MIKNKLIATLIALSLTGYNFAIASETLEETAIFRPSADRLEGLDAMINKALETFHIPGAAVGIIIDGKVVLTKGYGLRDKENNLPVTENTLFAIGSCTKAFTTHVLGQLADEGKISWDDPVIKHLPEFRLRDEYATYHVTIRDLITHQSGLPRHDLLWYNSDLSRNDILQRLQHLDSSVDLRGKFQYNNLMYVVAGLIVEKITGLTWEEAVHSRVLGPLGMSKSNFSVLDSQNSDDFSLPFREKNGLVQAIPFNNITIAGPAGSINSSVADMMKWIGLQLSEGIFEGRQFLKKDTLLAMHTPQVALQVFPEGTSNFFGYGLGWFTGMHEGRYFIAHGGTVDGFNSATGFLPKEKIGVVVLTNSDTGMIFADSLAEAILDRALGLAKDDWIPKAKEKDEKIKTVLQESQGKRDKDRSAVGRTAYPFDDYVGFFEHPGYGSIEVHQEVNSLMLSYHSLSIPLSHRCYDHFTGEWPAYVDVAFNCSFVRDVFGEISELNMPMESALGPIVFKRKATQEFFTAGYLKQFEGLFENDLFSLNIALKGQQLTAVVPGTSDEYVLIPEKSLQFSVKWLPGSTFRFTASNEKITEMLFITPQGTFKFTAK